MLSRHSVKAVRPEQIRLFEFVVICADLWIKFELVASVPHHSLANIRTVVSQNAAIRKAVAVVGKTLVLATVNNGVV